MRSAITVSLVPQAKGGPFVFWNELSDAAREASALGFDALEIFPPNAAALDVAEIQQLTSAHRLAVAAVGTGGGWVAQRLTLTHADAEKRREARAFVSGIIERAGALGAPAIIGSMQGSSSAEVTREQALAWLAEAFEELAELAALHGVPVLYEPLNRYETNLFNRLADTTEWLRSLRTRNVRILADLYHHNIEEANIAEALRAAGPLIGHVHFADSNRRAIGWGHTDVKPIIAALREIGYRGYLSAEVLPLPDSTAAARQTMAAFRAAVDGV